MQKLFGVGTDNAIVMTGVKAGVVALLKKYKSKIQLIPCVCHSIQLAVSSSTKLLPSDI